MKKYFCFMLAVCLFISGAFASTTTYERTLDNLQVAPDIEVNNYNKNAILNTPKVDETEKVYDFANLFTDSEEEALYSKITDFISSSEFDMAITTINYNPKNSAMKYADDFYDYNYFGKGNTHDGVLFLIDMDTREMWISTTGEAQIIYDDYRIDKILDATYNEISSERYYECALAFVNEAKYYYDLGVPESNKNAYIDENGDYIYEYTSEDALTAVVFYSIFIFIITLIITFIMKGRHKTIRKATTARSYIKESSITYRDDSFLTTNTVKTYVPPASSSSGGGSSTHRSSSGRSHGGGGRRF